MLKKYSDWLLDEYIWIGLVQKEKSSGDNLRKNFEWVDGADTSGYENFYIYSGIFVP